jgi:uncharacterized repeat protein (TIGR01451 family)
MNVRRLLGFGCAALFLLASVVTTSRPASATSPPCDGTIYALDSGSAVHKFTPPSYNPAPTIGLTVPYGTIARGTLSGNLFDVAGATVYAYDLGTLSQISTTALGSSSFIIAAGFGPNGIGYAISTTEAFQITETVSPFTVTVKRLPAPTTASPPALTTFNGGDLAVDAQGNGWIILSNHANNSYLYRISFTGTATTLLQVAQVTLNGNPYTTADLYSLAFGVDGTLYASSNDTQHLYAIDTSSAALTDLGSQGSTLVDFASCPFGSILVSKTGPISTAPGEYMNYIISVTNTTANPIAGVSIADTLPTGATPIRATCALCSSVSVSGQNVAATVTLPAMTSASINVYARDSASSGTLRNTVFITNGPDTFSTFATSTAKANILTKTITNERTGVTGTSVPANPGDTLLYTLSYQNLTNGTIVGTAGNPFTIVDSIPANTTYVASSAVCTTLPTANGSSLSCTPPSAPVAGKLTWNAIGTFAPAATAGQAGTTLVVTFKVTVN